MNESEQLYALRVLHHYFDSKVSCMGLDMTEEGLRLIKRYVLFCIEQGNAEDLDRILMACLAIPELKEWILTSPVENLKPVKWHFSEMCKKYDPGELGPSPEIFY